MWTPQYDVIVETLTGSEFEVTVTDKDTIGYIKSRIQKHEGIPVGQQHLLYKYEELDDDAEMKDIPLVKGSRLKLVIGMKGGPVSARRVVTLPDYDSWFGLNDILNTSRQDPLTITMVPPGVKLLVYKDCKKNIHRVMKFRTDRKNSLNNRNGAELELTGDDQDDQWLKDNKQTMEKMYHLRSKLDSQKKPSKSSSANRSQKQPVENEQSIKRGSGSSRRISSSNKKIDIGAVGDRCTRKDIDMDQRSHNMLASADAIGDSDAVCKPLRGLHFSSSKYMYQDNDASGSGPATAFNHNNTDSYCGLSTTLNKHGIAKTCMRPPSISAAQKQERKSPTPPPSTAGLPPPPSQLKPIDFHDYFNVNTKLSLAHNYYTESRSKIRDNIRRNRSFKAINSNDLIVEENNTSASNLSRPYSSVIDHLFRAGATGGGHTGKSKRTFMDKQQTSASVNDLIEKFSAVKMRSNKSSESLSSSNSSISSISSGGGVGGSSIRSCLSSAAKANNGTEKSGTSQLSNPLFDNKTYMERQQTFKFSRLGSGKRPSSGEFNIIDAPDNNVTMDSSFRVYKMTSEAKNCYELPKLLIREDSPVESFHSSDPQLETMALRGDSPKNLLESFPKIDIGNEESDSEDRHRRHRHHHHHHHKSSDTGTTIIKSPWSHHHSDLNLELNFLNDELSDNEGASCLKKNNNSVLKIASNLEINKWQTSPEFDAGNGAPHAASSLNFINSDLLGDDDDAFNGSCEMLHSNAKSKSVELNEFRRMFGSSPTLLNFNHPVSQTSRLDAVPFQYRRGYTNLNDACLSSSTSDLECYHGGGVGGKKTSKSSGHLHHTHHQCVGGGVGGGVGAGSIIGGGGGQELSSLLRHRNNGHLDYVRSYENLDRTQIVRLKNEKRSSHSCVTDNCCRSDGAVGGGGIGSRSDWKFHNHFERERVQEEDSSDDYSYSNLGYDNAVGSIGSFPVGYQSNESLFNINFDTVEDNIFEINKLALFEPADLAAAATVSASSSSSGLHTSSLLLPDDPCDADAFTVSDLSHFQIGDRIAPLQLLNADVLPSSATKEESISQPLPATPPKKPQKLRCAQCNRRLGVIMVMRCHCEKVFCAQHRYAEAHNCSYNFKAVGKQILERENPLVVAQKLPKI